MRAKVSLREGIGYTYPSIEAHVRVAREGERIAHREWQMGAPGGFMAVEASWPDSKALWRDKWVVVTGGLVSWAPFWWKNSRSGERPK